MISFIIPNWNQRDLLRDCIASIEGTAAGSDHEVIVVDNASTDGSSGLIRQEFPDVVWIQNDRNLGYARAVNQGVSEAEGDLLFLLNNDIVLLDRTTEELVSFLDSHPDAGAAAPLLFYPDGRLQISCRRFPTPVAVFLEKLGIEKAGPFRKLKLTGEEHLAGGPVKQPYASALLVRRQCWDAVGPMDEGFPIFFNDVDWCFRLYSKTDFRIYLVPGARAIHHEGASVNRLGYRKKIILYRGLLRFYRKHWLAMFRSGRSASR